MNEINVYLWLVLVAGFIAMLFSFWKTNWIDKQPQGTERMVKIGKSIADGAMAFLKAEYRVFQQTNFKNTAEGYGASTGRGCTRECHMQCIQP